MYLFERLISLGLYTIVLFLMYFNISHGSNSRNRKYITIYTLLLSVMGYFFVPHTGADLYRLFNTMHYYEISGSNSLVETLKATSTPGAGLYFFIIGKMHNDHLLPFFSALITFSLCFNILRDQTRNEKVNGKCLAVALFLFMSRGLMMQVISNIRTLMALSICANCIYSEYYKKTSVKKLIIPYVIAASLHAMGQLVLLYRLLYMLIEHANNITTKMYRIALSCGVMIALFVTKNSLITNILNSADSYYSSAQANEGYDYIWERVLSVFSIILLIMIISSFYKNKRAQKAEDSQEDTSIDATRVLIRYMNPIILIDIASFFIEFNFFQRTSWYLTILTMPICIQTLKLAFKIGNEDRLKQNYMFLSIMILFLACARGDLCSLKFFIL